MRIVGVYCPYCGGNTLFDKDSGKKHCFCVHCGKQIVLDDEVIHSSYAERIMNESQPRDIDIKDQIRLKELEADKRRDTHRLIRSIIPFVVGALYVLGFVLFFVVPFMNDGFSSKLLIFACFYLTIGIFAFDSDKFKDRKNRSKR